MKINVISKSSDDAFKVYLQVEEGLLTGKPDESFDALFQAYKDTDTYVSTPGSVFKNAWLDQKKLKSAAIVQTGDGSLKDIFKAGKALAGIVKKVGSIELVLLDVTGVADKTYFLRDLGTAVAQAGYEFDAYKTDKLGSEEVVFNVVLPEIESLRSPFREGVELGEATNLARQLVNEPANVMVPERIAVEAETAGKHFGFNVKVHDQEAIEKLNMPAYLSVAKASENKPHLIVMTYSGNPEAPDDILGLVGKGLSFDTGGYSLKSKDGMIDMKSDMGGAAAVIGAMSAIAGQKLKINVTAVVAACENMISGGGYRPGDIIQSRGGKTIFIKSTDAEGRLTLIDAVDYIIKDLKVKRVVDIATLTGAQVIALGTSVTGAVSNHDGLWREMQMASDLSGEKLWRMPLFEEIVETIKHKEADLTNAVREAGMITAGAFIGAFVGETPWIHLDIAGPSYTKKPQGLTEYGATGVGVKTLYYFAKQFC